MPYLLDTDWAIDVLGGKRRATEILARLMPEGVAISWITVGEIYEGAFGYPEPTTHLTRFREFVQQLGTLNLNDPNHGEVCRNPVFTSPSRPDDS